MTIYETEMIRLVQMRAVTRGFLASKIDDAIIGIKYYVEPFGRSP